MKLEQLLSRGNEIADGLIRQYLEKIHEELGGITFKNKKREKGQWECINLSQKQFIKLLHEALKYVPKSPYVTQGLSFVDAGCGIGHKMLLASLFGCFTKIVGIEITQEYIDKAKDFINKLRGCGAYAEYKFIKKDIRRADYSPYDVIYFYVPMRDRRLQIQFEDIVVETAKEGAVIVGVDSRSFSLRRNLKKVFCDDYYSIYKKQTHQDDPHEVVL